MAVHFLFEDLEYKFSNSLCVLSKTLLWWYPTPPTSCKDSERWSSGCHFCVPILEAWYMPKIDFVWVLKSMISYVTGKYLRFSIQVLHCTSRKNEWDPRSLWTLYSPCCIVLSAKAIRNGSQELQNLMNTFNISCFNHPYKPCFREMSYHNQARVSVVVVY